MDAIAKLLLFTYALAVGLVVAWLSGQIWVGSGIAILVAVAIPCCGTQDQSEGREAARASRTPHPHPHPNSDSDSDSDSTSVPQGRPTRREIPKSSDSSIESLLAFPVPGVVTLGSLFVGLLAASLLENIWFGALASAQACCATILLLRPTRRPRSSPLSVDAG